MLVIGIAGGSGSGKTSVVHKIIRSIPRGKVSVLSQDAYYKDLGDLTQEEREKINFDHPSAIEFALLVEHIEALKTGKTIQDWISDKILLESKILLKETSLSIKEISYIFGYSEPNHFSAFFKKKTKMLPSEYKKQ